MFSLIILLIMKPGEEHQTNILGIIKALDVKLILMTVLLLMIPKGTSFSVILFGTRFLTQILLELIAQQNLAICHSMSMSIYSPSIF